MLTYIKNQAIFSGILTSLFYAGSLVIETPSANAAGLSLISCEAVISLGDVLQNGCSFQMTNNGLGEEDTPFEFPPGSGKSASDFNLSGNPALDGPDLEAELGFIPGALSPDLFVQLQHGSAGQFRVTNETDYYLNLTLNWKFESTEPDIAPFDPIPGLPGDFGSFFDFYDALLEDENNSIKELARADSSSPRLFEGTIDLGRLGPGETYISNRFINGAWNNNTITSVADIEFVAVHVPEPMTILGSAAALGFGASFRRKKLRKKNKDV